MNYQPHEYQKYAIDFVETHKESALLLDLGLGKSSIALTAINDLLFDYFLVHKVLVVAPIRVVMKEQEKELFMQMLMSTSLIAKTSSGS